MPRLGTLPRICGRTHCILCITWLPPPRQDTLRPVDKYAVRWLEETGPAFDVAAAAVAAADASRADWDVDQLQALQQAQVGGFSFELPCFNVAGPATACFDELQSGYMYQSGR